MEVIAIAKASRVSRLASAYHLEQMAEYKTGNQQSRGQHMVAHSIQSESVQMHFVQPKHASMITWNSLQHQ